MIASVRVRGSRSSGQWSFRDYKASCEARSYCSLLGGGEGGRSYKGERSQRVEGKARGNFPTPVSSHLSHFLLSS